MRFDFYIFMSSAKNSTPDLCAHGVAVEGCLANPNPQRQRQLSSCSASEFAASIRTKPSTPLKAHGLDSWTTTSELPLLAKGKLEAPPRQAPKLNRQHTGTELGHLLAAGVFFLLLPFHILLATASLQCDC